MSHTPFPRQRTDRPGQRLNNVLVRGQPNHGANVMTKALPSGTVIEALPPRIRIPGSDHPWKISLGTERPWTVRLTPGIIYVGGTAVKPKVNNQDMEADPRPEISIGVGTYFLALAIRVDPVIGSQLVDDVNIYYLTTSMQKPGTQALIVAIKEDQWPPAAAAMAQINYRTSAVVAGEYYIGLGRVRRTAGNEAALTVLDQKWKTDITFRMLGDGDMDLSIR